jgi:site-specific DNA-cytosine methylase
MIVMRSFTKCLAELDIQMAFKHEFACEADAKKRQFIEMVCPQLPCLFGLVQSLAHRRSQSFQHGKTKVKDVPSVGTLIGGFPCKDVSLLNPKRASFADVVAQGGGKTGSAFKGILDYCRAHPEQLRCLILENVAGLDKNRDKG